MIRFFFKIILYIFLFFTFLVVWGRFFNPVITINQLEGVFKYSKLQRDYISSEDMGSHIKKAVIGAEDQLFYSHNGFDYKAIEKAYSHNQKGKKIRGGSTISQQTAKNVFLWNGGGYFRKGIEAVFTFVIEKFWGKDIILERYLNSIEMGRGVFGIEAAAQYYYGKNAKNLTKSEAAWIATILPSPKKYDPHNPSTYLKKRHRWIMRQMNNVQLR